MDKIERLLLDVGVPANLRGYQAIHDAVELVLSDQSYLHTVTRRLYPAVAEHSDTTAKRAERAIRHAIGVAFDHMAPDTKAEFFGRSITHGTRRPSNVQFIAALVLHLKGGA